MHENLGILDGEIVGSSLMSDREGRCLEEEVLRCFFLGVRERSAKALLSVLTDTLRIDWPPLGSEVASCCELSRVLLLLPL